MDDRFFMQGKGFSIRIHDPGERMDNKFFIKGSRFSVRIHNPEQDSFTFNNPNPQWKELGEAWLKIALDSEYLKKLTDKWIDVAYLPSSHFRITRRTKEDNILPTKWDLQETFGPKDIFNYAYAVFHSPTYRERYAEFLKMDFPRLPLTSDKELFKALVAKGYELVSLHLMESPLLEKLYTQVKFDIPGSGVVEKVSYDEKTQQVSINKTQYFEGVPPDVWNFRIGGYQICEKWLKDRQKAHRKLTVDDINHYQKIVIVLKKTIRLMGEIDKTIPIWPIK